jgi:hypothetical protein
MSIAVVALKWSPTYQSESAIYFQEGRMPSLVHIPSSNPKEIKLYLRGHWSQKKFLNQEYSYTLSFLVLSQSIPYDFKNNFIQRGKAKRQMNMARIRALLLNHVLFYCTSAVTVIPLTLNLPKPYESAAAPAIDHSDLLSTLHAGTALGDMVLHSTFIMELLEKRPLRGIYPSQDSLFRGAIDAGAKHQHLVIQPQDVWLAILKQLSFYLRKHKDDTQVAATWDNLDGKATEPMWGLAMWIMDDWLSKQFNLRSKASWLLDWVIPDFTTISNDTAVMMLAGNFTEIVVAKALTASSSLDLVYR